jgi:hypothetical protein
MVASNSFPEFKHLNPEDEGRIFLQNVGIQSRCNSPEDHDLNSYCCAFSGRKIV